MPETALSVPVDDFTQDAYGNAFKYFDTTQWEFPIISVLALVVVSFGIQSFKDVYFAIACQFLYWYLDYDGPEGLYNALAGLQVGRRAYKWIYLPTILTAYETMRSYSKQKTLTYKSSTTLGIYALGFIVGRYRLL